MSKLKFDQDGEKNLVSGVDHVVLYKKETTSSTTTWKGYKWNGITSWEKSPDGGDSNKIRADNIVYAVLRGRESYAGTVNCYSFPKEFYPCIGAIAVTVGNATVYAHEQDHEYFRACYREVLMNESGKYGYRYHVLYNLSAGPSDETAETMDDSIDPEEFGFELEGSAFTDTVGGKTLSLCEWTFDITGEEGDSGLDPTYQGWIDTLYGTDGSGSTTGTDPQCPNPSALFVVHT